MQTPRIPQVRFVPALRTVMAPFGALPNGHKSLTLLDLARKAKTRYPAAVNSVNHRVKSEDRRNHKNHRNLEYSVAIGSGLAQNLIVFGEWTHWNRTNMNNTHSRLPNTGADELPRELVELGKRLSALPADEQGELPHLFSQVVESVRRRRRILGLVQEALSQLRLDIKYLMFDLEVTRQERDSLKEQLEGLSE